MRLPTNVCLVEDDVIMGEALHSRLSVEGFNVDLCRRAQDAFEKISRQNYDVLLCDIHLPDMSGGNLFQRLLQDVPRVPPTVFMTAHGTVEHAIDLVKMGAKDYIIKPFDTNSLIEKLKAIISCSTDGFFLEQLGISPEMQTVQQQLKKIGQYKETPVLITGESGVGKEIVARHLHDVQTGSAAFVATNCTAIPDNLFESELFGHEKGAFTGAVKTHKGVFEQAHGGTLFLDEIGDIPLSLQMKLLRVLQDRRFKRIGGEIDVQVSVRLIFATNKNLQKLTDDGEFRKDLFYRINVIHIQIPPLRERKEDILWLADRFLKEHHNNYPGKHYALDDSAQEALLNHQWPGNVRELKHTIERACILCDGSVLTARDLLPASPERMFGTSSGSLTTYLETLEKEKIHSMLLKYDWRINLTAKHLNISRKCLWEKMKKYHIDKYFLSN
ncbi:MAG TPA: sigma-54 dependent transcriptional regulator [Gammaproteobacteria bacterium]